MDRSVNTVAGYKGGVGKTAATAALLILPACFALGYLIPSPHPPEDEATHNLHQAQLSCEEFVKKSLHPPPNKTAKPVVVYFMSDDDIDPDSAEFDDYRTYPAEQQKYGIYSVQVNLNAYNVFEAKRRLHVNCTVRHSNSGDWQLMSLEEPH